MKLSQTELSYRRSAIEGASTIGLMIALFDTLVGDLRRAAFALRKNDIETRCRELNHATLVLGQLNEWIDPENGKVGHSEFRIGMQHLFLADEYPSMDALGVRSPSALGGTSELAWLGSENLLDGGLPVSSSKKMTPAA